MARITFEVTQEQHTYIKMMAASKGISIRDYFLQQMEKSIPVTDTKRISRRTRKTLEAADKHQHIHFCASTEEFYAELGLDKFMATNEGGAIGNIVRKLIPSEKPVSPKKVA
jgi:hypothetical protein